MVRLGSPAAVFPGNMALGATRDVSLSYQNAHGARAFGDQTNLAAVLYPFGFGLSYGR